MYPPSVERWRPLVSQYFRPEDVDKALWVIQHESGGDASITGDGGWSHGLFQMNRAGGLGTGYDASYLNDPENNIALAAQAVYGGSGWKPWGEGSLYNGQAFGSLGHNPYPGYSDDPTVSGYTGPTSQNSVMGGNMPTTGNPFVDSDSGGPSTTQQTVTHSDGSIWRYTFNPDGSVANRVQLSPGSPSQQQPNTSQQTIQDAQGNWWRITFDVNGNPINQQPIGIPGQSSQPQADLWTDPHGTVWVVTRGPDGIPVKQSVFATAPSQNQPSQGQTIQGGDGRWYRVTYNADGTTSAALIEGLPGETQAPRPTQQSSVSPAMQAALMQSQIDANKAAQAAEQEYRQQQLALQGRSLAIQEQAQRAQARDARTQRRQEAAQSYMQAVSAIDPGAYDAWVTASGGGTIANALDADPGGAISDRLIEGAAKFLEIAQGGKKKTPTGGTGETDGEGTPTAEEGEGPTDFDGDGDVDYADSWKRQRDAQGAPGAGRTEHAQKLKVGSYMLKGWPEAGVEGVSYRRAAEELGLNNRGMGPSQHPALGGGGAPPSFMQPKIEGGSTVVVSGPTATDTPPAEGSVSGFPLDKVISGGPAQDITWGGPTNIMNVDPSVFVEDNGTWVQGGSTDKVVSGPGRVVRKNRGGFTRAPVSIMGDASLSQRPDAGGAKPEVVFNPTGAPIFALSHEQSKPMLDIMGGGGPPRYALGTLGNLKKKLKMPKSGSSLSGGLFGNLFGGASGNTGGGNALDLNLGDILGGGLGSGSAFDTTKDLRQNVKFRELNPFAVDFFENDPISLQRHLAGMQTKYGVPIESQVAEARRFRLPGAAVGNIMLGY